MPKVFISYRRQDSNHIAARIRDVLADRFGKDSVFFDVDSIPAGVDFPRYIKQYIEKTDIVIAVIGPKWSLITNEAGSRRIDDPEDYLRIELETAISNQIHVLPVLVGSAAMPGKKDLPLKLLPLCSRNAVAVLDDPHFRPSMQKLIHHLEHELKMPYEDEINLTVQALKQKIDSATAFDFGACALCERLLRASTELEGRALLQQARLFTSGQLEGALFVAWLGAEKQRQAKALRRRRAVEKQTGGQERERLAEEAARLKAEAERERRAREDAEGKLQAETARLAKEKADLASRVKEKQEEAEQLKSELARRARPSFFGRLFESRTLKTPEDIEAKLKLPLIITVPDVFRPSWRRYQRQANEKRAEHPDKTKTAASAPWDVDFPLRAYHEGLRDRLLSHFDRSGLARRGKLVAVTSCNCGAGVTTMAAGLGAALSETGDGNVLLVDMKHDQGAAHPFHQGKPAIGLSEAFDAGKPDAGRVNENLYLVSAKETNDQRLPHTLPRRFASLVPKMNASVYDYIIFDMPPVSEISITPRLANFMDMVLLVVEAGRTRYELAQRSVALLAESKAYIGVVLNKAGRLE